jgi:serine/threonine protein kinase
MMSTRKQKLETMINEVEHLQSLRHPHIIQLVGSYLQGKKFAILLYPVAQWNLSSFLELCQEIENGPQMENEKAISPELCALPGFFQCIAHALAYVHANTIKHMDMKPQNILVRANLKGMDLFSVYL